MTRARAILSLVGAVLLFTFSFGSTSASAGGEQLAIVVAANSPVSGLSFHELKRMFMGERVKNPMGKWIVPLNRKKKSAERIGFDESVLGMTPNVVGSFWIDRKIRGQSGAPKTFKSSGLILRLVSKVPGAIGYVKASDVKPGVKVVKIDGKLPGEAGYAIKM